MFEYYGYLKIIGYFDNIHFDLFYIQEMKKAIYSTKESKEREFVQRICDKENLYNFFREKNEKSDYKTGWGSFLKKYENITSVSKTDDISNKRLDVADGVDIPQDTVCKQHAVEFCHKEEKFDLKNCTPYIRATYRKTNEIKSYDMTYNFEREGMNDENCIPATSEIILLVKK